MTAPVAVPAAMPGAAFARSLDRGRRWVSTARLLLREAAGSLGDIGTFVPIAVGMVQIAGLDAASVLVFAGLASIVTGWVFRVPMAVQPMKAIGALAIGGTMTAAQVGVAGATVGLCMVLLVGMGLVRWMDRVLPRAALRGLQMVVALQLVLAGARMVLVEPGRPGLRPFAGPEGLVVAAGALALMALLHRRLQWAAIGFVALGLVGAAFKRPDLLGTWEFHLWRPRLASFDASAMAGIWLGGLAQVPLTLLNSVFAVSVLAIGLFPDQRERNSPARIAASVGLMNLLACPFGAMPLCHGSGGLAGQHQFGARTGWSLALLGGAKLVAGLFLGSMALAWMQAFPTSILCPFLVIAGISLARASRCWETREGLAAAVVMGAVQCFTGILLAAFAAGWAALGLVRVLGRGARSSVPDLAGKCDAE